MWVDRQYRSFLELAAGGMGTVELALREEAGFERLYAVKRIRAAFADDVEIRAMFVEEARLAGLIRHANVVSVLDVGDDDQGPYLAMDFIEGLSLGAIMRRHRELAEPMPIQLVLRIGIQACAGLHAAHELVDPTGRALELVHRDVSPQNILVGFDGVVRLTDFGIARALGRSTQTEHGVVKGKLSYMSPEQLCYRSVDRRSDIFAMGVVLFQLASGNHPFGTNPAARAAAIIAAEPGELLELGPSLPPPFLELIFEMLAESPDLRPTGVDVVRLRFEQILNDLVASESVMEVAEYMAKVHDDERRILKERIREGRVQMAEGRRSISPMANDPEADPPPMSRPWKIGVAIIAGIAALVAFVSFIVPSLAPPAPQRIPVENPVVEPLPPPTPTQVESVEGAQVEPEVIAPEAQRVPRPPRRSSMRRGVAPAPAAGAPIFLDPEDGQ